MARCQASLSRRRRPYVSTRRSVPGSHRRVRLTEEDGPLLTLPEPHGPRPIGALEAESRREEPPHLALGDRKRRAGGAATHGKEAREQPASRLENRAHGPDVLGAARGIDGAEARVLPDAVERTRRAEYRSEEHTSELQSRGHLVCRL